MKSVKRTCPACGAKKLFRLDQKTCGCLGQNTNGLAETNEIAGDKWTISLPKTRISSLEKLIEYCKVDLSVWEVERFVCNKWEVGMGALTSGTGRMEVVPLFQIKAFLRRKRNIVDAKAEIESLKKLWVFQPKSLVRASKISVPSGNMLELNMPDPHFGKLAWGVETGGKNYDVKIAQAMYDRAADNLLIRVGHFKFDEIVFVVGNDLLNSDDLESRTTKGTTVSTDGRYQKTFEVVRTTIIRCIEKLRAIAPVRVVMVSGNHDQLSVWHLGDSLECWFSKYRDVTIDNSPKYRKYYQFGKVMLMFTHGDKGKRTNYPLLMATEQPKMFGETEFREAHTGHNHVTKVDEYRGVFVRILPSLSPPDDWHAENGFVKNKRSAEAYVWNKKEGLVTIAIYTDSDEGE